MKYIDAYFKKKVDKITFIELKGSTATNIKGYPKNKVIPLPMVTDNLVNGIVEGEMEEGIKISHIVEGIIYLMGIDPEFIHMEDYKSILEAYNENAEDYTFYQGIKAIEEEDYQKGVIYFRALRNMNPNNINGVFNYALALEGIAKTYFDKEQEDIGMNLLKESTYELETILDIDDKYPLAYYKLGYHYKFLGQYLKAKLTWTKHLTLDRDDLRLQEIRGEIELIENDVAIETGLTYLSREYYEKALEVFLKLLPKFEKWWELRYLIGVCYKGMSDLEKAIDYFEEALEFNKESSDVYNELGICLFTIGNLSKAIEIFTEGIKNIEDDYKLMFNRGLSYLQLGKLQEAYEDIGNAVKINPNDEGMNAQKAVLDNMFNQ